jgi:hypothetical protein
MTEPQPIAVGDALTELVHQFSDPYAFVRELVQNAVDAGSAEIDVDVTFDADPASPDVGVVRVRVADFGEGMTREIIEKKLTRLFSSSKDGDRTKIGKFGIGFVSVFALDPEIVIVDTSRGGESWRVLFRADRSFELIALAQPVDGTKVELFKSGDRAQFGEMRTRVEESLRHWCEHVKCDVRFGGLSICVPFDLPEAPCRVEVAEGETRIVVGHARDHVPSYGLYNEGLTLTRGRDRYFDAVAFKASSPALEHTLTRDAVIEDDGYAHVLAIVGRAVDDELARRVFAMLEERRESDLAEYLHRAAAWHAVRAVPDDVRDRVAFVTPSGRPVRVRDCKRRPKGDALWFARERAPVTDELETRGHLVVHGTGLGGPHALAAALVPSGTSVKLVRNAWCRPLAPESAPGPVWTVLAAGALELVRAAGSKAESLEPARFDYPDSPIVDRVAVAQVDAYALDELADVDRIAEGLLGRRRTWVVNIEHPTVRELLALGHGAPVFAAYLLAKALLVGRTLDPRIDARLATRVVAR